MAGKQFTRCVSRANYDGLCGVLGANLAYMLGYGLILGILGAIAGIIVAQTPETFVCGALVGGVAGFVYGLAEGLRERYENQRLICISPDECAVGRIAYHKTGPSKG